MERGVVEALGGVVVDPVPLGDGEVDMINDDVCALCGDGGLLLCCEGPCLKSFHATTEAGEHCGCPTLGFTTAQVEAMQHFFCEDCANGQHQITLNHDVCALCGDGGILICCDGPCLRSFHATRDADPNFGCITLGYTTAQVEAMQQFFCTNCTNRQHQCARCGLVGSSDPANPEVLRCNHATCGRFYHPVCIGARLHPFDPAEAARRRQRVAAGMTFQCRGPGHLRRGFYRVYYSLRIFLLVVLELGTEIKRGWKRWIH